MSAVTSIAATYKDVDASRLLFDALSHTYVLDGQRELVGVSHVVKRSFPEFDADAVIRKMRSNPQRFNAGPYAGMTDEQIKAKWENTGKQAADEGTRKHASIETKIKAIRAEIVQQAATAAVAVDEQTAPQEIDAAQIILEALPQEYLQYAADTDLHTAVREGRVRCEWRIYDEQRGLAGTIDCAIFDRDDPNKVTLVDWKFSRKAHETYGWGRTSLVPDVSLEDAPFWRYSLQLNLYRTILERQLGL
jgi:ATP-dependent exoDNAse (exonuclease V) beta subunit